MIQATDFLSPAIERGYSFWTGVPCSILTPFINSVIQHEDLDYIGASSEGEAVGVAAGAHLAGRKTVVICQNSGLGNTVNPLTSLNYPFKIPTIVIVTHRGAPGLKDEPQHEQMGRISGALLDALEVPWEEFPMDASQVEGVLGRAESSIATTNRPYALLMKKGSVEKCTLEGQPRILIEEASEIQGRHTAPPSSWMSRNDAIACARELLGEDAAIIATTGKTGRELFTLGHRPGQLYVVGSMGCASGMALGLHEAGTKKDRIVAVMDGDGAALMKMGTMATIGHYRPERLLHFVIDNEAHESTGGQKTVSSTVDFAGVAAACGYRSCARVDTPDQLAERLLFALKTKGPHLVHVKVRTGSDPGLGRPTMTPVEVKEQFMDWWSR